MEEVVHVPESELFGREAEIVFSVDTSTEVSLIAENTVVPILVRDHNPENLDCELLNQPAATSTQQNRRRVVRRALIEEAELVLVDTIGFSGIPENIVLSMQ